MNIPSPVEHSVRLTDYAVISRYPGDVEEIDESEYYEALRMAEIVFDWAEQNI